MSVDGSYSALPSPSTRRLIDHKVLLCLHHTFLSDPLPLYNPDLTPLLDCVKAKMRLIHIKVFCKEKTSGRKKEGEIPLESVTKLNRPQFAYSFQARIFFLSS